MRHCATYLVLTVGLEQLLQRPQNVRTEPTSLNGVAKMSERSCTRVLPTEPSESGTAQQSACTKQPHLVRWRMHIRCRLSDFGAQPVSGGGGMLQLHDRTSDSAPTVREAK
jgi:hypothetical protein